MPTTRNRLTDRTVISIANEELVNDRSAPPTSSLTSGLIVN